MRKDGGGGATAASSHFLLSGSCLDAKPFAAALVVITLFMATWQLRQPYQSIISSTTTTTSSSSAPCTIPSSSAAIRLASTTNSTPSTTNSSSPPHSSSAADIARTPIRRPDPNKRVFESHGTAAALFVQMGAYRGGVDTFAIVGLASKPTHVFGKPWFKCEWVPSNSSSPAIRTKAYKMLPDWGYGRVYTVVVVNCTFPSNPNADNAGGKLLLYAYYSSSPRRSEKFVALEEPAGSFDESRYVPPFPYDYLYCGSSLYGDLSASRIREWMAYHAHLFGPRSHFVFHDAGGVSKEVMAALRPWVAAGRATVQDVRGQAEFDGYYYNQFLVVNDCLHRYRHAANWTFFFDVDEYIFVDGSGTFDSVMRELSPYTQFTIEQYAMSSKLCVLDPGHDYSRDWGFEKLVFRDSRKGIRRDRKYAIQARNAYATGVHMSENVIGKTSHKTEWKIRYYHYHNSINVMGEPCREFAPAQPPEGNYTWLERTPYEYDDSMKRFGEAVRRFEEEAIGKFRV